MVEFKVTSDPDVLEAKSRSGFQAGLGALLLFIAFSHIVFALVILVPVHGFAALPGVGLCDMCLALAGAMILTHNSGATIHRGQRLVTTWSEMLGWRRRQASQDLDSFDHVFLMKWVVSRNGHHRGRSRCSYPVHLKGRTGIPIKLGDPGDYKVARALAEQVATFLQWDVVDRSTGSTVVREAESLGESLRETTDRTGDVIEALDPPDAVSCELHFEDDALVVDLPRTSADAAPWFGLTLLMVMGVGGVYVVWSESGPREGGAGSLMSVLILLGLGGLLFGYPMMLVARSVLPKMLHVGKPMTRIVVSPRSLQLQHRGVSSWKVQEILADELEELILPREDAIDRARAELVRQVSSGFLSRYLKPEMVGKGIIARSDRCTLAFAHQLSAQEKAWLHALIKKKLTS